SIVLRNLYFSIWYTLIKHTSGNIIKPITFKGNVEFSLALEFTFSIQRAFLNFYGNDSVSQFPSRSLPAFQA
ncbi:MAG: hypothetical protein UF433_10490, partial [Clostridium sp.]|nr:hypothetical protein [Clostridium sp.]